MRSITQIFKPVTNRNFETDKKSKTLHAYGSIMDWFNRDSFSETSHKIILCVQRPRLSHGVLLWRKIWIKNITWPSRFSIFAGYLEKFD